MMVIKTGMVICGVRDQIKGWFCFVEGDDDIGTEAMAQCIPASVERDGINSSQIFINKCLRFLIYKYILQYT